MTERLPAVGINCYCAICKDKNAVSFSRTSERYVYGRKIYNFLVEAEGALAICGKQGGDAGDAFKKCESLLGCTLRPYDKSITLNDNPVFIYLKSHSDLMADLIFYDVFELVDYWRLQKFTEAMEAAYTIMDFRQRFLITGKNIFPALNPVYAKHPSNEGYDGEGSRDELFFMISDVLITSNPPMVKCNHENYLLLLEWLENQECTKELHQLTIKARRLGLDYNRVPLDQKLRKETYRESDLDLELSSLAYYVIFEPDHTSHKCYPRAAGVKEMREVIEKAEAEAKASASYNLPPAEDSEDGAADDMMTSLIKAGALR